MREINIINYDWRSQEPPTFQKLPENELKGLEKQHKKYIRCFSASLKFVSTFRLLICLSSNQRGEKQPWHWLKFSFSLRLTTALGMKSLCPLISKWPLFVASVSWRPAVSLKKTIWSLPEDGGERINMSNSNLYTHCSAVHVITEMLLCPVKPRWVGSDDHPDGGSGHHGGGPGAHQGEGNQHQTAGGDPQLALSIIDIQHAAVSAQLTSVSLQSDIMDVNQIFKDLAVMIHDQGEMIGK